MNALAPTPTLADVCETLREIVDPELGCNIVDLGLVYDVVLHENRVWLGMTLTSPGCPMGNILVAAAKSMLCEMPGIEHADVHLVWDPPWSASRMSPEARKQVGIPAEAETSSPIAIRRMGEHFKPSSTAKP